MQLLYIFFTSLCSEHRINTLRLFPLSYSGLKKFILQEKSCITLLHMSQAFICVHILSPSPSQSLRAMASIHAAGRCPADSKQALKWHVYFHGSDRGCWCVCIAGGSCMVVIGVCFSVCWQQHAGSSLGHWSGVKFWPKQMQGQAWVDVGDSGVDTDW